MYHSLIVLAGTRMLFALFSVLLILPTLTAQHNLPVIHASKEQVTVRDGEIIQSGIWNLFPATKPDIYYALQPERNTRITFYTNLDSISFNTTPGQVYDFIILLNGTDSCYTRISTIPRAAATTLGSLDSSLAASQLREDFQSLRKALEMDHPGLYRFLPKLRIDRLFDSINNSIEQPLTPSDFGKKILFLLSALRDGHTGTDFTRRLVQHYSSTEKMFPLLLYFNGSTAHVWCSRMATFPAGTQIHSIDGIPVEKIKNELYCYLPSDGYIQTKKKETLNNGAFPFLYRWIFGQKNHFVVAYTNLQGERHTATLPAASLGDFECEPAGARRGSGQNLDLQFPAAGIALLTVRSFDERRIGDSVTFHHFLDTCFRRIADRNVSSLIIDLRGNAGGTDAFGALLYAYLADKPFGYFRSVASTTRVFMISDNYLLGMQSPRKLSYRGRVYFLINGLSFSTTADFCAVARSNERGLFIGEETGGGYYGNVSGYASTVHLIHSGIKVTVPRICYTNKVRKLVPQGRGIIPDYIVVPTMKELLQGRDPQMERALRLAAATTPAR